MSRQEINLAFEILEPKILLAGNVTVKETNSGLKISGDIQSNLIDVQRVDADTVSVTGLATTVNGAAGAQLFDLGNGNVKLNFKQGGDDFFTTLDNAGGDLELRSLKGRFSDGNDFVEIESTNTEKAMSLQMGAGDNFVKTLRSSLRGNVRVQTGADGDTVILSGRDLEILGKATINTGAGDDYVEVRLFGVTGSIAELTVLLGAGTDYFLGNSNRILGVAAVDGGDGVDKSEGTGNTFAPGNPVVTNFELLYGQWL